MVNIITTEFLSGLVTNGRIVLDYAHLFFDKIFYICLYMTVIFTLIYMFLSFTVILVKKNEKGKKFDANLAPKVTIQIPTRNEIVALRCAQHCLDFDYPKDKYEILIGDDSDDVEVSAKIAAFAAKYDNVKAIKRAKNIGFKPGNLNNMLKHSKGDILVLFDSDFTPEKDFLKRIVTPFIYDDKISAVQAKWKFNNFNQNGVTILASTIVYVFHHVVLSFMHLFGTGSLCGSAEAVKKKDLIELGKWKSGSLTEDIELSLRMHKSNKKLVYLPNLECNNEVPFIAKDLYKQQMRWAYGVISSYKEHLGGLLFKKGLSLKRKLLSLCSGFGYGMPVLILILFVVGTLSFATHRPGPIDLPRFLTEMIRNIILTSGLLFASFVALAKENKMKYALKTLVFSFSIGLITTYYVNKGIFKSLVGKPMEWFLLNKNVESTKKSINA